MRVSKRTICPGSGWIGTGLAVNWREARGSDEIFALFEDTAGRAVKLRVGPNPNGEGARSVTVVPIASEASLRLRAWMDDNRRKVDKLSNGRLAYVWMFKRLGEGTLVGTRTWGGLIGIGGYPALMDGGTITAPRAAFTIRKAANSMWKTRAYLPISRWNTIRRLYARGMTRNWRGP